PDPEIFTFTEYSYEILSNRLRELAFLNSGLSIKLSDEREEGRSETYLFEGGIRDFVNHLASTKEPIHDDVIAFETAVPAGDGKADIVVDFAIQWCSS